MITTVHTNMNVFNQRLILQELKRYYDNISSIEEKDQHHPRTLILLHKTSIH